jgi:hypothetical protein
MTITADESTMTPHACAQCQSPATNKCAGCLGAPSYGESGPNDAYYCGRDCQKAHWHQHKSGCRELRHRIRLQRAANLLKAIICRVRLHAATQQFKSMRVEGATIYLDGVEEHEPGTNLLRRLVVGSDVNQSSLHAVLAHEGCTDSMVYLHYFAKELLSGRVAT